VRGYPAPVALVVEPVDPRRTAQLRQRVLRPHEPLEALVEASAGDASLVAFAVVDPPSEEILSCALVRPEEPPAGTRTEQALQVPAWRLRGMATAEARRGEGLGSLVLGAVLAHLSERAPALLWCNARLAATAFYERAGLRRSGEAWEEPFLGPHVRMWRLVADVGTP